MDIFSVWTVFWSIVLVVILIVALGKYLNKKEQEREQKELLQRKIERENAVIEDAKAKKGIVISMGKAGHYEEKIEPQYSSDGYFLYYDHKNVWHSNADYANGWDIRIGLANCTGKVLKYCSLEIHALNAVGDLSDCLIGDPIKSLYITGPIAQDTFSEYYWSDAFYTKSLNTFKVASATVTYMDNTKEELTDDRLIIKLL